jgi:hypothetical protein
MFPSRWAMYMGLVSSSIRTNREGLRDDALQSLDDGDSSLNNRYSIFLLLKLYFTLSQRIPVFSFVRLICFCAWW